MQEIWQEDNEHKYALQPLFGILRYSDRIQIQTYLTNKGSKFYTELDRTCLPAKSRVRPNSEHW